MSTQSVSLLLVGLALLLPARPAAARELDLTEILKRADVIVLARVEDPPTSVTETPIAVPPGHAPVRPYDRYRRFWTSIEILRGKAPAQLAVDEPAWRAQLQAYRRCHVEHKCVPLAIDAYRSDLAREPRPGQVVLGFLHRTKEGELELVAERAIDSADRAAEIRAALRR